MENTNEKVIKLLNSLIEINNDRVEGYEKAAKETDDQELKSLFSSLASQSRSYKIQLIPKVTILKGKTVEGTTTSGKFYRAWMDIKAALSGKDRHTIISSCEFGEDVALNTYEDALKSDVVLSSELRQIIQEQRNEIKAAHDKIKGMRDTEVLH